TANQLIDGYLTVSACVKGDALTEVLRAERNRYTPHQLVDCNFGISIAVSTAGIAAEASVAISDEDRDLLIDACRNHQIWHIVSVEIARIDSARSHSGQHRG